MAKAFLQSHGIDIDAEMARIQSGEQPSPAPPVPFKRPSTGRVTCLCNVSLPSRVAGSTWDVHLADGRVSRIRRHGGEEGERRQSLNEENCETDDDAFPNFAIDGRAALVTPSLCHPHIHLDKAYLLSHPAFAHLQIQRGDFAEAMDLTSQAKSSFTHADLLERGQRVIDESVGAGVTHMRAFVEVDAGVGTKCLDAGRQIKRAAEAAGLCRVQICPFAQLPLFSSSPRDESGEIIRQLMSDAAMLPDAEAIGSTPYVEESPQKMRQNVDWMIELSITHNLHLDFHLDYNLDQDTEPLIWYVIQSLKSRSWLSRTTDRTIVLGHCTRLTLFSSADWQRLKSEIADLPIFFVGLPTSDLFMMRTPTRQRGTLDVPALIKEQGLNACLGVNNIGNAFTPHGSCDPLLLACNGVGLYQAGTNADAEILYECISTRARAALGFACPRGHGVTAAPDGRSRRLGFEIEEGDPADLILYGAEEAEWRTRKSVSEAVYLYDHGRGRKGILAGRLTS